MTTSSKTARLAAWDHAYLWHPFTQMQEWEQDTPLIIEKGRGSYLIDTEGRRYLDGTSSIWVNLHGHRHPRLDRALRTQLRAIAHSTLLGLSNPPAIRLARESHNDYLPELEAVSAAEMRLLFGPQTPPLASLKPGEVIRNTFRYLGTVRSGEVFYLFARLDVYEQAELSQKAVSTKTSSPKPE